MKSIYPLIFIFLSQVSHGDDCTGRVESYLDGLRLGIEQKVGDQDWAYNEIQRIESLREKIADCDVEMQIPALIESKAMSNKAYEAVKRVKK